MPGKTIVNTLMDRGFAYSSSIFVLVKNINKTTIPTAVHGIGRGACAKITDRASSWLMAI